MARIEEYYSELYDSDPVVTIQTYPTKYHQNFLGTGSSVEENAKEAGKDQVNIETFESRR